MSHICEKLHKLFNRLTIFSFPFDKRRIPWNGIYILFERGEFAHGTNRIVRVGTHTGSNQLRSRLEQHFLREHKDRSIFRKNIGRAILNLEKDPFLSQWELDLTTHEAKQKHELTVDLQRQNQIEGQVTDYIQGFCQFVVFTVDEKEMRLRWESKIISSVSLCEECEASENWLGKHSSREKIRRSGLWNVNELYKQPLMEEEYNLLERTVLAEYSL